MELNDWKTKNNRVRRYAHFDERVNVQNVWKYISKPENIEKHGFYPLIHTKIVYSKYNKVSGIKEKKRDIYYSAHIDRLILSYYGFLINNTYNKYVCEKGISENIIAYRDNLAKSNIEFSKDAFDFIRSQDQAIIIVGDFTKFFDNLDHKYLKQKLLTLLGKEKLPNDLYAIYKYVTKFVYWELDSLLNLNGYENNKQSIREFNMQKKALSIKEFKEFKKDNLNHNETVFGIPQGTAISALFSNIYMMEFDEKLSQLVREFKGMYNRYSDDFIMVFPNMNVSKFKKIYFKIDKIIRNIPNLSIQQEKTQVYEFDGAKITNINKAIFDDRKNEKDVLDYLGFTFDGSKVRFRDKTLTKYYYKMYRKTKGIIRSKGYTKRGNRISNTELYKRYSIRGVQGKFKHSNGEESHVRNFLSYVLRAEKIYANEDEIHKFRKRHLSKIRKQLKKIIIDD